MKKLLLTVAALFLCGISFADVPYSLTSTASDGSGPYAVQKGAPGWNVLVAQDQSTSPPTLRTIACNSSGQLQTTASSSSAFTGVTITSVTGGVVFSVSPSAGAPWGQTYGAWTQNSNNLTPSAAVVVVGSQGFNAANNAFQNNLYQGNTPVSSVNALPVNLESGKNTYFFSVTNVAVAAAATDVLTITGSGTKTVRLTRLQISGIATAASAARVLLAVRSSADSAGTGWAPALVPADSNYASATAAVKVYTANPTLGTLLGLVRGIWPTFTTGAGAIQNVPIQFDFELRGETALVLRGTSQQAVINLDAQTVTGLTVNIDGSFTEE